MNKKSLTRYSKRLIRDAVADMSEAVIIKAQAKPKNKLSSGANFLIKKISELITSIGKLITKLTIAAKEFANKHPVIFAFIIGTLVALTRNFSIVQKGVAALLEVVTDYLKDTIKEGLVNGLKNENMEAA